MRAAVLLMLVTAACGRAEESAARPTVDGWERPPSIVAGAERTCVMLRDGGVACWGNGWTERLGDGRMTDSPTPVRVEALESVVKLAGAQHTCALTAEGQIFCWGPYLPTGLVGAESHADFPLPTLQPFVSAIDVDAGRNEVCGLAADGRVQCRSPAEEGPLGLGLTAPRQLLHEGTVACAIGPGGALGCAGRQGSSRDGYTYEPEPASGIAATDLARGVFGPAILALRPDGHVVGRGRYPEGDWSPVEMPGPVAALGDSRYGAHACVVLADGGVACWGLNDRGQLGDGTFEDRRTEPVRVVGLGDAVAVAAGREHSCAIRRNGRVACWGANDRGQLGDGTVESSPVPVEVVGLDLTATPELTVEPHAEGLCLERDTDGDGLGDRLESQPPYPCHYGQDSLDDGDDLARLEDDDSDGDGFPDEAEHDGHPCFPSALDCDGDGVMEYVDRDSDNDGVWDLEEGSLRATCTSDSDGDGCDDLSEHVLGGCLPENGVALAGRGRTHGAGSPAEVVLTTGAAASAPTDVTLHVEELEVLRPGPLSLSYEPAVAAVSSDGDAVAEGAGFRGAAPGEALRFEVHAGGTFPYFDGDTASARAALVLRDTAMNELARGTLLIVVLPDGTCPGP